MATNTTNTFTNHTGNNTAGPFSISFGYLAESEVVVTVDGVTKTQTTHYTFPSATTISFTSGNHPANSAAIKFQRNTSVSSKKVDFQDGSVLTESDLDTSNDQLIYSVQEILDSGITEYTPGWTNSVTRTIKTRLQDTVYVKDFGAIGDGSTNDTDALQKALTYVVQNPGKELVLTAGVYKTDAQISVDLNAKHEQLHIRGDGNVIIKFTPGSNVNCLRVNIDNNQYASDVSTGAPRVSIRNIEFAYDVATNGYGQAIRLEGANAASRHTQICLIDNCQFVPWDDLTKWFSVGLYIKDLHEVSVQNCSFYADNNQDNNQANTGVWIESTSSASACHYYFNNSTFLYGDCGIRVGPVGSDATSYVEGLYVNNCGFVACDNGIIMDGDESGNDAVEPGLQVTNCHFNTNTSQYGYGISTDSIVDILLLGNLFYSGRNLTTNPGSASYRGCVFINQGETFNITGNNFKSIGEGPSSANIYDYGNYHNTAIRIGAQTNSALIKDIGLIQNNLFDGFKGTEKAIWLEANTTKIQAIETLNAFNECDTNILDQGTNNIIQGKFGGASSSAAGSAGLVPKPAAGDQTKYLKADGTWSTVSGGSGSTNLTNTANATSLTVESSSGNDTSLPAATTSAWGVMTDEDKTKLDGIATSATANAGTITSVTGTSPIASSGGTTPAISISAATTSAAGSMSSADKTKLDAIEASADVTDATNVNSAGAVMNTDLATKGQILVGDGSGDPTALAVGTDDYVLTADATEATGVKWAAVSGGGGGGISNVAEDTSPQLGGNLDVQANEITTSTTNGNIVLNPNGEHGVVRIKGDSTNSVDGTLELRCSSNSHGVKIKSPPHSAAQTYTLTLPSSIVTGGFLKTDSNGGLSFATPTDTNTTYSAGTGLSLSSTTFNLDTITSVGTIGTGTWQGTAIADSYIASASTWNSKQAALTFGIANDNAVEIDDADAADDDYAKFTANGIEGRSYAEVKTDLSLNNVENTAVSTWAGSSNITTLGTVSTVTSTAVATAGVRKIHAGTSTPSSGTGAVGDIYVKY